MGLQVTKGQLKVAALVCSTVWVPTSRPTQARGSHVVSQVTLLADACLTPPHIQSVSYTLPHAGKPNQRAAIDSSGLLRGVLMICRGLPSQAAHSHQTTAYAGKIPAQKNLLRLLL